MDHPRLGRGFVRLDQLQSLQAGMPVLADDDVVVHGNSQWLRDFLDRLRHLDIGARRRRVAGGVIMEKQTIGFRCLKYISKFAHTKMVGT